MIGQRKAVDKGRKTDCQVVASRHLLNFMMLFLTMWVNAQTQLNGIIKDTKGTPVFAANVYPKNNPTAGVITDFDGKFSLKVEYQTDTLVVSFLGYTTKEIPFSEIDFASSLQVKLKTAGMSLAEVVVSASDPISEQFSVAKLEKLEIYMSPFSQGDALKAITALPASTTADESANPSLRGSSAERSRVILNGVPIYRPVRNSQINGIGNFSIFNTEIVDRQHIYASNPPLTFGNTSAGLVEIETIKSLNYNQLQVSGTLASTGVFLSKKIKGNAFIQAFSNYQFSDAFLEVNPNGTELLNKFGSKDIGMNLHKKFKNGWQLNSFSYAINEAYDVTTQIFSHKDKALAGKKRAFTVNNLSRITERGKIDFNLGHNRSDTGFSFGNLNSKSKVNQWYASANFKYFISDKTKIQTGVSLDYSENNFRDSVPQFYYALSKNAPNIYSESDISNRLIEPYFYINHDLNEAWSFSGGLRTNIQLDGNIPYLSGQGGMNFRPASNHSFLLSGGHYNSYATPNFYNKNFTLLKSNQVAFDYTFSKEKFQITAATYYKKETGGRTNDDFFSINQTTTYGLEFSAKATLSKYVELSLSNSFIDQKLHFFDLEVPGNFDFNYFVKAALQFNHPKFASVNLSYIGRPGSYFNQIDGGVFQSEIGFFEPIFTPEIYGSQYPNYNRVDLGLSRYFTFNNQSLVVFVSVANLLNFKNPRTVFYDRGYENFTYDFYQQRTIFFGAVWAFNQF